MKKRIPNHPNGDHSVEEEDPQEETMKEEEAMEEEEAAHPEVRQAKEPQCLLGPTYPLTYNPSPMLLMQNQWENSPTSLTGTKLKLRHSSIS